jgi:hypothetical protein
MGKASPLSISARMDAELAARSALSHAFYDSWRKGMLSYETIGYYATQYLHYIEALPQAISSTHACCPSRLGRRLLAEALTEAEGVGGPHLSRGQLWITCAASITIDTCAAHRRSARVETRRLLETLARLSRAGYASAVGALYTHAAQAVAAITFNSNAKSGTKTTALLPPQHGVGLKGGKTAKVLLDQLSPPEATLALAAGIELNTAFLSFFDGVYAMHRVAKSAASDGGELCRPPSKRRWNRGKTR